MELKVGDVTLHENDLIIFTDTYLLPRLRRGVLVDVVVNGAAFICGWGWLTAHELAERKPVIVGYVERRWWGNKKIFGSRPLTPEMQECSNG